MRKKEIRATRKTRKTKEFGVEKELLKFFPKTSPMGFPRPSRWTLETPDSRTSNLPAFHYPSLS
jgi:hypothetical protein